MEHDCGAGFEYKAAPPPGTVPESVYLKGGCTPHDDGGYCCPTCAICMEALAKGATVGLACGDKFHKSCHDRLRQNPQFSGKCPSCRQTEAEALAKWGFEDPEIETSDVPAPQQNQQQQNRVPAAMHNLHHRPGRVFGAPLAPLRNYEPPQQQQELMETTMQVINNMDIHNTHQRPRRRLFGPPDAPPHAPGYPNSRKLYGTVSPDHMPAVFAIPLVGDHDPFARPEFNKRPIRFVNGQGYYHEGGREGFMILHPRESFFGNPLQTTFWLAEHEQGGVSIMYIAYIDPSGQAYIYEDRRAVQHE
jgi:hypothetical protein